MLKYWLKSKSDLIQELKETHQKWRGIAEDLRLKNGSLTDQVYELEWELEGLKWKNEDLRDQLNKAEAELLMVDKYVGLKKLFAKINKDLDEGNGKEEPT